MNALDPAFAALLEARPECAAAYRFKNTFEPAAGVDYRWVVQYAKDRMIAAERNFKDLDEKAGAVFNALAGGTGVVTLGSLAAVSAAQVSGWVVLAALPSVACALVALWHAKRCRVTAPAALPPPIPGAVEYAEGFADRGEAAFLGQLHLCVELMQAVNDRKARCVDRALWLFALSVAALVLPLAVGLLLRLG